jgi:alanine dehydrogenase
MRIVWTGARGGRGVDEAKVVVVVVCVCGGGIAAKITKHCGADVTPPDTIIDCLHRLNHLWLAGYKYEHEKIGKQVHARAGVRCGAAASARAILSRLLSG